MIFIRGLAIRCCYLECLSVGAVWVALSVSVFICTASGSTNGMRCSSLWLYFWIHS